jgi:pimeloyl-ACP methyl ester carboxylesterase
MQNGKQNSESDKSPLPFKDANTVVIIHGAWSSADDWGHVFGHLTSAGGNVVTVNLAGHGSDRTPVSSISLQLYVFEVLKAIGDKTDITLVGHSFGGIVASEVAELIAPQIKKIIYVAAFVPKNGDSLLSLAKTDSESIVGKNLIVEEEGGVASIAKEGIAETFMADAPASVVEHVTNNLRPEPLAPLATPVTLTKASFGQIAKVYVHSQHDRTISYTLQQRMVAEAGITRTYSLPSSHTPFIVFSEVLSAIVSLEASKN